MNEYKITLLLDSGEVVQRWSGYTEQVAITQAFTYNSQRGERSIKVLSIEEL